MISFKAHDPCPRALEGAYWAFVAAAIMMTVTGLVGFFGTYDSSAGQFAEFMRGNRHFLSWANLSGAFLVALFAPQLARAMKHARTVLALVTAVISFCNIASIAIGVGGLLLVIVVFLLLAGTVLMFRPGPNKFIRERNRSLM